MDKSKINGKEYWRSLDQLADTPEFREFLEREFPEGASELDSKLSRRNFISLMGASMALAGLAGCRRPVEKIIPYVVPPDDIIPGVANHYATSIPMLNSAYGLIVESHEGHPTKIEGNPEHPSSLGMSNVFIQASILGLYDPDRSKEVRHNGRDAEWTDFLDFWEKEAEYFSGNRGEGLAILAEPYSSPTMSRLAERFKRKYPKAIWATYSPVSDENIFAGLKIASGSDIRPVYHYDKARIILSLDSDFLFGESENITSAKGYADGRRLKSEKDEMNRLYVVESGYSVTGAIADHRLRLKAGQIARFLAALIKKMQSDGVRIESIGREVESLAPEGFEQQWIDAVWDDLLQNQGGCLVVAGHRQPPAVHAMVYAVNQLLGNIGSTVEYYPVHNSSISSATELADLMEKLRSGSVRTLFVLGGNPVYDSYTDLKFKNALKKAQNSIHLGLYADETGRECTWHIPQSHYLESWGDTIAADGTMSVIQPMTAPLFWGHNILEIVGLMIDGDESSAYELTQDTWKEILSRSGFEKRWNGLLHDGLYADGSIKPVATKLNLPAIAEYTRQNLASLRAAGDDEIEIVFTVSSSVFDGRYANNGWLQELPDPITKLSWDNAALISPSTAEKFDLENEDVVIINYGGGSIEAPIWIAPGHADNSISLELGYGRESCGRIADGVGFNAYKLRTLANPYIASKASLTKAGRKYKLATTQDHSSMEGRPIVREATIEDYRKDPMFAPMMVEHPPLKSLWTERKYDEGYQWGMAIDLNSCIGCNACTIACQSENNIPIVGKDQVSRGREMHWIRIDRYFNGDTENPEMVHQPVACHQCENAPCEQVCPVAATMHDKEGLNVQVYNRCVGTRYCSNNCPYKVRRFNFYNFTKDTPEIVKMAQNPDVTVRSRGVMEKCTYCVQRISEARIKSKMAGTDIKDGDIVTACQQACPTQAIVFGNVNDPESEVSKIKTRNRNYNLLEELNTRPRTSFLARIRNPNPKLS